MATREKQNLSQKSTAELQELVTRESGTRKSNIVNELQKRSK